MKRSRALVPIIPLLAVAMTAFFLSGCGGRSVQTSYNLPAGTVETVDQSIEMVKAFGKDIPPDVLNNAAGIAVIPDLTKAAFVIGGQRGTGVLLTREGGEWSLPVFASITGGSIGYQVGIQMTDLVLVFQNPEAISKLRGGSFELGADASVAAGPVGGTAGVSSRADVLAYREDRGAFIGASLSGSRMSIDPDRTAGFYSGPGDPPVRGYYGLTDDLLDPRRKVQVRNVPSGATELKRTLDSLTAPR
jgi:lipid-binding SYLF domain-containing protein